MNFRKFNFKFLNLKKKKKKKKEEEEQGVADPPARVAGHPLGHGGGSANRPKGVAEPPPV
jgi:hypothetical protein